MTIGRFPLAALLALVAGTSACASHADPAGDATTEDVGVAVDAVDGETLVYGRIYNIENGYQNGIVGGYLDTRNWGCQGNLFCVSTATTPTRDSGSGSWRLVSATGKPDGSPVIEGDLVYLKNQWIGGGGFLDTRGLGCQAGVLCVSTAVGDHRDGQSGTWKITGIGTAPGAPIAEKQDIRLQNGYWNYGGGYLDTLGAGCQGNHLCVTTSATPDRDHGSTHWRFVGGPRPLVYGRDYRIQNGYYPNQPGGIWGGYLDTRSWGCMNHICVSTAVTPTRDGGSGTWRLLSADGKPDGTPVADGDIVHLQNRWNGGSGGFLDTAGAGCQGDLLCVSTAVSNHRDGSSGTWKILGDGGATGSLMMEDGVIRLQNAYWDFGGGYLDTRNPGCQGNHLCVATSATMNRAQGSTHWMFEPLVRSCAPGTYSPDGQACVSCPAHEIVHDLKTCKTCPWGQVTTDHVTCAACPAGQVTTDQLTCTTCPAGQTALDGNECITLIPWDGGQLPDYARVVMRASTRRKSENCNCTGFESFGPAWVNLTTYQFNSQNPTYEYLDASGGQLTVDAIFRAWNVPRGPTEFVANNNPSAYQKILLQSVLTDQFVDVDMGGMLVAKESTVADAPIWILDRTHGTQAQLFWIGYDYDMNAALAYSHPMIFGTEFASINGLTLFQFTPQGYNMASFFELFIIEE